LPAPLPLSSILSLASLLPAPRSQDEEAGASRCAKCHREIHAEWAASAHGLAWKDPLYQTELKKATRRESCIPCHIPQPLQRTGLSELPLPREEGLDDGVGCDACHLGKEGAYHGPFGGAASAHESVADPLFSDLLRTNEICLPCHSTRIGPVLPLGRDFEREGPAEAGKTCVSCHMDAVERRVAIDEGLEREPPVRAGRSHRLRGPREAAFAAKALEIETVREGDGIRVVVRNEAGHRVPGLVGREFVIRFTLLGAEGAPGVKEEIRIDHRAFLPANRSREVRLESARGAESIRIEVVLRHPDRTETLALDERRPLGG
jgi:hypothetical protein